MPKLPVISGADTIRALERLGCVVIRQNRSHVVMRCQVSGCVVPNHRELKIGTLAGILKQAGISPAEFITALHN